MEHATGITLILGAALLAALYRLLIKLSGDRLALIAGLNGVSTLVALCAVWFVPFPPWITFGYLAVSSLFYTAAMVLLMRGYAHADFGRITPLQGAIRVLVIALLMVLLFGEEATVYHWVAAALVCFAFIIQSRLSDILRRDHLVTLLLALGIGAASGIQYVVDTGGVRSVESPWSYIVWNLFIGTPIFLYGLASRAGAIRDAFRSQARPILLGSGLDMSSYAIILLVVHYLAMVDILPFINLYVLFTALLGALWLKEPFPVRRIIAGLILLVAAMLVELA